MRYTRAVEIPSCSAISASPLALYRLSLYCEDMNTTTSPAAEINLTRVLNGWYSYNRADRGLSFTIIKELGFWSVAEADGETWTVKSLDAARALIASQVAA